MTTGGIRTPGQVTIDKIGDHLAENNAGELESAAFQSVPGFVKPKGGVNPEQSGNSNSGTGGGNAPGGAPLGYPVPGPGGRVTFGGSGTTITLSLFKSLQDPANGAVLGNCMMALLQDALDNQIAAHKQQVMAAMNQIGVAMGNFAATMKDVADTRSDAQEKESADMTSAWVSIGAGVLQAGAAAASMGGSAAGWSDGVTKGISDASSAVGTLASGISKFEDATKDGIDANSGTLQDKVQMANLEVLQKIADANEQSKKGTLDDATDHLHNMRDMLGKLWQSKVDNMNAAQLHK